MLRHLIASEIRAPFANFSHGVLVETGSSILFCSGQLGISPDDRLPCDILAQARLCFDNVTAVLNEASMNARDVVRINAYLTDREYWAAYMVARDEFLGGRQNPPASTLMVVSGFAHADMKVEVEVIAAKSQPTER